jgi:murein L,D-transpeptidase YcbB/YkuD
MATPGKRTQVQLLEQNAEAAKLDTKEGHKAPTLAEVRAGDAVLKIGDHGPAVEKVQHLLHKHADGKFDEDLRFAVEKFQHKHHLPANGKVGRNTLHALEKAAHHHPHPSGGGDDGGGVIIGGGEG